MSRIIGVRRPIAYIVLGGTISYFYLLLISIKTLLFAEIAGENYES